MMESATVGRFVQCQTNAGQKLGTVTMIVIVEEMRSVMVKHIHVSLPTAIAIISTIVKAGKHAKIGYVCHWKEDVNTAETVMDGKRATKKRTRAS